MRAKVLRNLRMAREYLSGKKLRVIAEENNISIPDVDNAIKRIYTQLIPSIERLQYLTPKSIVLDYRDKLTTILDKRIKEEETKEEVIDAFVHAIKEDLKNST
jgi:predicted DNA-binding protein YlxM (UPF0122 family)